MNRAIAMAFVALVVVGCGETAADKHTEDRAEQRQECRQFAHSFGSRVVQVAIDASDESGIRCIVTLEGGRVEELLP